MDIIDDICIDDEIVGDRLRSMREPRRTWLRSGNRRKSASRLRRKEGVESFFFMIGPVI